MKIETRDFGSVEIAQKDVVSFLQPIFGFERLSDYVLLYDQNNSHIVWLQSVEDRNICFILVNPAVVGREYDGASIPRETRALLGEGEYLFWVVTVVAPRFQDSTVNLKSPIVINPKRRLAAQVILDEELSIRYPLLSGSEGRG